jgi:hypothetical protein
MIAQLIWSSLSLSAVGGQAAGRAGVVLLVH